MDDSCYPSCSAPSPESDAWISVLIVGNLQYGIVMACLCAPEGLGMNKPLCQDQSLICSGNIEQTRPPHDAVYVTVEM